MKTIWKFNLQITDFQSIEMPAKAEILSAQIQAGTICVWAMVDPSAKPQKRNFVIFGTGREIENEFELDFIDSIQMGIFVWHLFEKIV